jgi:hypothetical protein
MLPPLDLRSYQYLAQLLEKEPSPLELPSVPIWFNQMTTLYAEMSKMLKNITSGQRRVLIL